MQPRNRASSPVRPDKPSVTVPSMDSLKRIPFKCMQAKLIVSREEHNFLVQPQVNDVVSRLQNSTGITIVNDLSDEFRLQGAKELETLLKSDLNPEASSEIFNTRASKNL